MSGIPEKLDAIIVDPDADRRMRLRSATIALPQFRKVEQCSIFHQASQYIQTGEALTIFFISSTFEKNLLREFIDSAKTSQRGCDSAYILTMPSRTQDTKHVADGMLQGADGFLFEPFSVDQ